MGHTHPSTATQRAQWAADMLAHQGDYGIVTRLSREHAVSRPTLYAWRDRAQQAVRQAFTPAAPSLRSPTNTARQILTLWITHASDRGIQAAMQEVARQGVSLASITAVLTEAQQRALVWMQTHVPAGMRALALDEIYANNRRGAYLNVVDVHSGAVWSSEGPLTVDTESWTLVLWSLQERGLCWDRVVSDDGAPIAAATRTVTPQVVHQRDQWHLWHSCAQTQGRLDRRLRDLEAQTPVVARQAARLAAGQRPQGRKPKTDLAAHAEDVVAAERVAEAVRFLTRELRRLLEVVVIDQRGVLDAAQRQADLEAALALLGEVAATAPAPQQAEVQRIQRQLQAANGRLLAVERRRKELQAYIDALTNKLKRAESRSE